MKQTVCTVSLIFSWKNCEWCSGYQYVVRTTQAIFFFFQGFRLVHALNMMWRERPVRWQRGAPLKPKQNPQGKPQSICISTFAHIYTMSMTHLFLVLESKSISLHLMMECNTPPNKQTNTLSKWFPLHLGQLFWLQLRISPSLLKTTSDSQHLTIYGEYF